ncbi:MAG: FAD-dependent oxidoreductase [Defluviitaleaceae bacterium]|nr:FAD-dependent oxidoreductase [Defluviitaleaceae bacterium]
MLKHLFSPITIKGKVIKNRCVVPAMVTNYCTTDGEATDRFLAYHEARAKGGFGLIITEDYVVNPTGKGFSYVAGLWKDEQIEGHSKLPEIAHKHGAVILAQIYHCGRQTTKRVIGTNPYAPSSIICPFGTEVPVELTVDEIKGLIEDFGDCALRAKKCGFDGVEIHGGHGYLIAQFMSLYSNKRTDQYGGPLQNRLKFPLEIIKNIREKCGKDFIIGFRISGDEFIEGGRTIEETKAIVPALEIAGIDIIHVSAGVYASADAVVPPNYTKYAWISNLAKEVKAITDLPVISVGRINDPQVANSVIQSGCADFAAMGRASIIDPDMPVKAEEGRFEEIRRCIACNQGCLGVLFSDNPITCTLNPVVGKEKEFAIVKAENPKKVAVAGAGPAGLEAAIVAASAGHDVVVYEKSSQAGGNFRLAAIPPSKGELAGFINWQTHQLDKLKVPIHYNKEATCELFEKNPADVIIVATGATQDNPPIPGADLPHVATAGDVLSGKSNVGASVVVIGGGSCGAETANHLAVQLRSVTLIEMTGAIATEEAMAPRLHLLKSLENRKVAMLTNTKVAEITSDGVKPEDGRLISADSVVLATGYKSNNGLFNELSQKGLNACIIGDADSVGLVLTAVKQGYEAGLIS